MVTRAYKPDIRKKPGKPHQVRVHRRLDPYWRQDDDGLKKAAKELREVVKDLDDWCIEMDMEYGSYGDRDRDYLSVTGWMDASEDQIRQWKQANKEEAAKRKQYEDRQIESLRKTRPELFKDES